MSSIDRLIVQRKRLDLFFFSPSYPTYRHVLSPVQECV